MSFIAWNPEDKHTGITLSDGNLTCTTSSATEFKIVRATVGRITGKWYFEINIEQGNGLTIGIADIVTKAITGTSYTSLNDISNLKSYSYSSRAMSPHKSFGTDHDSGQIVGIKVDLDNGTISAYKNGVFEGEIYSDLIHGVEYYPIYVGWTSEIITANFGATEFDIATSNPDAWQQLVSEGYKPYDIDNATWLYKVKHLIKSSNKIKTLSGEIWIDIDVTTPTALDFETHGMNSISTITQEKWAELQKPVEIYTWTDNIEAVGTNVNYTYNHFEDPELELTVPEYRLIDKLERPISILTYIDGEEVPVLKQEHSYPKVGSRILRKG